MGLNHPTLEIFQTQVSKHVSKSLGSASCPQIRLPIHPYPAAQGDPSQNLEEGQVGQQQEMPVRVRSLTRC